MISEETAASNAALIEGSLIIAALTTSTKARLFSEAGIMVDEGLESEYC